MEKHKEQINYLITVKFKEATKILQLFWHLAIINSVGNLFKHKKKPSFISYV